MSFRRHLTQIAAAAAFVVSGGAFAAPVDEAGPSYRPGRPSTLPAPQAGDTAGQFTSERDALSFVRHGTELPLPIMVDPDQEPSSTVDEAVAQALVREVVYATSGGHGSGTGTLGETGSSRSTQGMPDRVHPADWEGLDLPPVAAPWNAPHGRGRQDQPVATAVPEPGTLALLFAGLGAIGIAGRRRAPGGRGR